MKEFADNNFKFNEYDRKSSKRAENTVGKGDIACYEQFLPFPECFPKTCSADMRNPGLVWERVKIKSYLYKSSINEKDQTQN